MGCHATKKSRSRSGDAQRHADARDEQDWHQSEDEDAANPDAQRQPIELRGGNENTGRRL